MTHRTYTGIRAERAIVEFDALRPWVSHMIGMRAACTPLRADDFAILVALQGVQTAAYHFTRRRHFYDEIETTPTGPPADLSSPTAVREAFTALAPYFRAIRRLQDFCRPFGPDWCALEIPRQGLCTAALHFTGRPDFYGAAPTG